jgi:exopolyphosphatase/guanosine-5'-triphosphate,3'-diphosphate pyrophosphatase
MPSAIIDLGTNTFNLLVFERGTSGLLIVKSLELSVFLGKGGIEQGVITEEALQRGMDALRQHRDTARSFGANTITGFGTSALRNARNGQELTRMAQEELGIPISIIPGDEEAALILEGVKQAVPLGARPALVMDIGGGSTEFILATEKALMWKRSFELGVTRLRERFPVSDSMDLATETRIAQHLDDRLEPLYAIIDRHRPHLLIGSAGSFDTLATMVAADRDEEIHPGSTTMPFNALTFLALKDRLMRMSIAERRTVKGLPEHRV